MKAVRVWWSLERRRPCPGRKQSPGQNAAFAAPASRTVSYTFTAADPLNRDSVTDNGVLTNYTANKMNQYSNIGGQGISYDSNFNLTGYAGQSYTFNAQDQLVAANGVTVQLVYDGLGRVLKRTINNNATIFVYDGWKVIEELNGSGGRIAWNIYGAGSDEILYRNQSGTVLLYHTDKEGNVMFLLDGAGNGIERYTYDAFGAAKIMDWAGNARTASAYGNRFMFNGKDYVAEMGLYDYRHRWYQPQLGRFLQVDPKGFDAGDENLFRYCADDPVDKTDPEGLLGGMPEQSYSGMVPIASGYSDGVTGQGGARAAAAGSDLAKQYGPAPSYIFAKVNTPTVNQGAGNAAQAQPDRSQYVPGEAYKATREVESDPPLRNPDGTITSVSRVYIKVSDRDGKPARDGTSVTEVPPVSIVRSKDLVSTQSQAGFTKQTKNGQLPFDTWRHTFSSPEGFVVRAQVLTSGNRTLRWNTTQTINGVETYRPDSPYSGYFW